MVTKLSNIGDSMTILESFDYVAALSPDLAAAIRSGRANPKRWSFCDQKLIDVTTGLFLYEHSQPDRELEMDHVNVWLRSAQCLQIADTATFQGVINAYSTQWQSLGFESLSDLGIANIHDSANDLQLLWSCQQIQSFLDQNQVQLASGPNWHSGGLLLLHGMGGCEAISRLITALQPRLVLLFETDLDLIAKRIEDRRATEELLLALQQAGTTLFFITDTDVDQSIHYANILIAITSLQAQAYCFCFRFREMDSADEIDDRLGGPDACLKALRYLGFFVDELHMLMNGILTFAHTEARIVSFGNLKEHQRHAVIVASGPSLAAALPLLKAERERFDLICSFSTLGPLLKAGIVPDYHCQMERHADACFMRATPELQAFAGQATLLTSANVDPRLAQLYQNVFTFLRSASTASALLASDFRELISSEGSETANAAIVFAVLLGYRKLHLFGVDFGAVNPETADRIDGALHYSDRTMDLVVKGNLRDEVWTSQGLKEAAQWVGSFLDPKLYPPAKTSVQATTVYNYSDGQWIPRTISARPEMFGKNLRDSTSFDCIAAALSQTNGKVDQRQSRERILGCDVPARIRLQCQVMRQLALEPLSNHHHELCRQTCCDLNTGSLIDQVVTRLFAGTLSRIWIYLLILTRLIPQEVEAAWEEHCRQILRRCIDSMEALSLEMLAYALALPSLEEHTLQSVFEEKQGVGQV